MTFWGKIRMMPRIVGLFLAVGLLPMALVAWLAGDQARASLLTAAFAQLESIRELKKEQIRNYVDDRWQDLRAVASITKIMRSEAFKRLELIKLDKKNTLEYLFQTTRTNLRYVREDPFLRQALLDFNQAFATTKKPEDPIEQPFNTQAWQGVAAKYRARLRDLIRVYDWSDLLFINTTGAIVFTATGGEEQGQVIPESFLRNTSLGMAWRSVMGADRDEIALSEFFPYPPHNNNPTAFLLAPVIAAPSTVLGYLAVPIGNMHINAIVQHRAGMGQSGEPYLVGQVNGTTLYRSDRIAKGGRFGDQREDPFVIKALAGKSGGEIKIGSTGLVELVQYAPLDIPGLDWAILVTMQAQEAITPLERPNATEDLFSRYVREKHLADLLLTSPDGTIFYSVDKEADHQSNLLHGPFATSHLGALVQSTLLTKTPGISDFAPYAPSGGIQTAFMVEPILAANNEVELLVVLQLSHADLDKILNKREGMGETGETFLVGETHGKVSYRNDRLRNRGRVGQSPPQQLNAIVHAEYDGATIVANGDTTLVSHTKLALPGLQWTLLATMDSREVYAPIQHLLLSIALVSLGLTSLVILLAVVTARGMTTPIRRLMTTTKRIVAGDWSARVAVTSTDEIGDLGTLFNQLAQFTAEQYWLQKKLAQFAELSHKSSSPKELAQQLVSQLAEVLHVGHGVVYVLEENGRHYKQLGSFGCRDRNDTTHVFNEGETLIGQCASENRSLLLTNTPENYIKIASGLGEAKPLTILAVPISFRDKVLAVVEIASFNPITPIQRELLEQLSQLVGLGLENLFRHQRTQQLLAKTQAQAGVLAKQQEELQENNEELKQQAHILRTSEQELQKQREQLQAANKQLKQKAKHLQKNQRALQQAQTQIEEKARALAQASRYKSEFLANMSHELRTPLNSLLILARSFTENQEGNLTTEQLEASRIMYGSGRDLLALINDILDLAKIEAGRVDLLPEDLNLRAWARELQLHFSHVAKDKGLALVVQVASDTPESIQTDPQKMQQIVKNFLANAFKFTDSGQVVVQIHPPPKERPVAPNELRIVSTGGQEPIVAISVTDTGIGIAPDKLGMIFDAFQQADGSTSRRYGGTGLGLSISRELAMLLGGAIRLHSTVGQGSTFTLLLPKDLGHPPPLRRPLLQTSAPKSEREREPPPAAPLPPAPCPIDDQDNLAPGDQRLLIIDNDPDFAALACQLSRARHFKCLIATDGRSGLDLAARYHPNGIILALDLPDMDGITVLTTLKELPETRTIPVCVSSNTTPCRESRQRGAIGHLAKPVQQEAFEEWVQKITHFFGSSNRRVLVVEDDAPTRQAVTCLLQGEAVAVSAVGTGEEAYRLLTTQPFDCMVLDLSLPDISGFELLHRITHNQAITRPPVVIYSGRTLSRAEHEQLGSSADSIITKGTHFEERLVDEVTLFLHCRPETLSAQQQALLHQRHDPQKQFQGKRLLIVDDDMRSAFAMKRTLRLRGCEVLIAADGRKALTLLEKQTNIDAVLMDIMMPELDGYQTIRTMRNQESLQQMPILAISAKATLADRQACLEAGANDFIAKPVDTDRLLAMLRFWLYR